MSKDRLHRKGEDLFHRNETRHSLQEDEILPDSPCDKREHDVEMSGTDRGNVEGNMDQEMHSTNEGDTKQGEDSIQQPGANLHADFPGDYFDKQYLCSRDKEIQEALDGVLVAFKELKIKINKNPLSRDPISSLYELKGRFQKIEGFNNPTSHVVGFVGNSGKGKST